MAFDPSTAVPDGDEFDPTSAKLELDFDPGSAKLDDAKPAAREFSTRNEDREDYVPPINPELEPDAHKKVGFNADALDPRDIRAGQDYRDTLGAAQQRALGQTKMTTARRGATGAALREIDKALMRDSSAPNYGDAAGIQPLDTAQMTPDERQTAIGSSLRKIDADIAAQRAHEIRPTTTSTELTTDAFGNISGGVDVERVGAPRGPVLHGDRPDPSVASVSTDLVNALTDIAADVRDTGSAIVGKAIGDRDMTRDAVARAEERRATRQRDEPQFKSGFVQSVYSGVKSTAQQLPGVTAAILTANPAIGLAWAAVSQGAPVFTESLKRGDSVENAAANMLVQGGAEALFELVPMRFLVDRFGKTAVLQFLGGLAAREVPLEIATSATQSLADILSKHNDGGDPQGLRDDLAAWTNSLPEQARETTIATVTQVLLMGAGSAAARRVSGIGPREQAPDLEARTRALGFTSEPGAVHTPDLSNVRVQPPSVDDVLAAPTVDDALAVATAVAQAPNPAVGAVADAISAEEMGLSTPPAVDAESSQFANRESPELGTNVPPAGTVGQAFAWTQPEQQARAQVVPAGPMVNLPPTAAATPGAAEVNPEGQLVFRDGPFYRTLDGQFSAPPQERNDDGLSGQVDLGNAGQRPGDREAGDPTAGAVGPGSQGQDVQDVEERREPGGEVRALPRAEPEPARTLGWDAVEGAEPDALSAETVRAEVAQRMGEEAANKLEFVDDVNDPRFQYAADAAKSRGKSVASIEGYFNRDTGRTVVLLPNVRPAFGLSRAERARWVGGHEAFHAGAQAAAPEFGGMARMLESAGSNPQVAAIAAVRRKRGTDDTESRSIEEAMVEIGAALNENRLDALAARYEVSFDAPAEKGLRRLWESFVMEVNRALRKLGIKRRLTNREVVEMLGTWREAANRKPSGKASGTMFSIGEVEALPQKTNWAVVSAEDPGAKKHSDEFNAAATARLEAKLKADGVQYTKVTGKYGELQNSFILWGDKVDDRYAESLRREFDQESVLIPEGLLYANGELHAATGESREAPEADDYYTLLDGKKWQYGIDFDNRTTLERFRRETAGQEVAFSEAADDEESASILRASREISKTLKYAPITEQTPAATRVLVARVRKIVDEELARDPSSAHWYRDNLRDAMAAVASVFPEVATDPASRTAFVAALAITSNGLTISQNVRAAFQVYEAYRRDGRMPAMPFGVRGQMIANAQMKFNEFLEELGADGLAEFLATPFLAGDLKGMFGADPGFPVDFEVYGSAIFGPKIGHGFFSNLSGRLDAVTMDRWFFRSWGRLTNTMVRKKNDGTEIPAESKIKDSERAWAHDVIVTVSEQERAAGRDVSPADIQAILWYYEKKLFTEYGAANEAAQPTDYATEVRAYVEANYPDRLADGGQEQGRGRGSEAQDWLGEAGQEAALDEEGIPYFSESDGSAEPAVRSGPGSDGGREGSVSVVGVHYGKERVGTLLGSRYGSGLTGEERKRIARSSDPRIKRRVYFYVGKPGTGLPPAEGGLGPWVYRANLDNMYEPGVSPALDVDYTGRDGWPVDAGERANRYESAILDAGYDGYIARNARPAPVAVVMNKDVPVELLGNRSAESVKFSERDEASWSEKRIDRLISEFAYTNGGRKDSTKAYAGFVSPNDYLAATTPLDERDRLDSEARPLDREQLGQETQPIFLEVEQRPNGILRLVGHEGRHRMLALGRAGVRRVPVVYRLRDRVDNAQPLTSQYVTAQRWGDVQAQDGFLTGPLLPISWNGRKALAERFGKKSDFMFSERDELPDFGEDARRFLQGEEIDYGEFDLPEAEPRRTAEAVGDDVAAIREARPITDDQYRQIGRAWLDIGSDPALYALGFSGSKRLQTVFEELQPGSSVRVLTAPASVGDRNYYGVSEAQREALKMGMGGAFVPTKVHKILMPVNAKQVDALRPQKRAGLEKVRGQWYAVAKLYEDAAGNLALNSQDFQAGTTNGTLLYQAVGTWALNAGKVFYGDPAGLSDRALFRRTEQMFANAIRTGTTRHLRLHGDQIDAGLRWKRKDTEFNIGLTAVWLHDTLGLYAPDRYADLQQLLATPVAGVGVDLEPTAAVGGETVGGGARSLRRGAATAVAIGEALQPRGARADEGATDPRDAERAVLGRLVDSASPLLYSEADPVDSPQFKRWFGNSKVVDAEGKPLRVYHGTRSDKTIRKFRVPAYFTDDPAWANDFGSRATYPAYLKIERPYELDGKQSGRHFEWDKEDVAGFKRDGFDGVIIRHPDGDVYTVFDRDQIRSAVEPDVAFSEAEPFYSELRRQVGGINAKAMTAGDWIVRIKSLKGVKADEVTWSGIEEWLKLQPGKVTKDAVLAYLDANGVRVEEVELGGDAARLKRRVDETSQAEHDAWVAFQRGSPGWSEGVGLGEVMAWGRRLAEGEEMAAEEMDASGFTPEQIELLRVHGEALRARDEAFAAYNNADLNQSTQYESYQIPGGENYRELLLKLPLKPAELPDGFKLVDVALQARNNGYDVPDDDIGREWRVEGPGFTSHVYHNREDAMQDALNHALQNAEGRLFTAPHFGNNAQNLLAHVRFNERTDADGKRVLFIEELQSDWAQQGREKGFGSASTEEIERRRDEAQRELRDAHEILIDHLNANDALGFDTAGEARAEMLSNPNWRQHFTDVTPGLVTAWYAYKAAYDRSRDLTQQLNSASNGVPAAPFVGKTEAWAGLLLKRMIRYAAENGFDRIAWTTGEQQVERYRNSLRQAVDKIEWRKTRAGVQIVGSKNGRTVVDTSYGEDSISDAIGKAMADQIISDPNQSGEITGDDITISSTGMAQFYDKIVPNIANDLLKKLGGARVGEVNIDVMPGLSSTKPLVATYTGPSLTDVQVVAILNDPDTKKNWPVGIVEQLRDVREAMRGDDAADFEDAMEKFGSMELAAKLGGKLTWDRTADRTKQPGFDITPALRDRALAGLPLFSQLDPVTEEAFRKAGLAADRRRLPQRILDHVRAAWARVSRDGIAQGMVDRFHGIKAAERTLGNLPAEQSAYVAARLSTGLPSLLYAVLTRGAPVWRDGILQRGSDKGLLDIFKPVQHEFNDWIGWMVGTRANRLMGEGRENNFTQDEIDALIARGRGKEQKFKDVAKEFARFKRMILDVAEGAGLVDATTRPVWDQADWIPFYRVADEGIAGPFKKQGLANQSAKIRKLTGGEAELNDPLGNILMNFSQLLDASLKNHATKLAIDNLQANPEFVEKVGMQMGRALVPVSQIKKVLEDQGVSPQLLAQMPPAVWRGVQKMWSVQAPTDPDVIRVMRDGKAEYWRVNDPLLLRSLTAVTAPQWGEGMEAIMRPLRAFKRILTRGVTATPDFLARNFIRDSAQAHIVAHDKMQLVSGAMKGAWQAMSRSGNALDIMFAGGSFLGGHNFGGDPAAMAHEVRRSLRVKGWKPERIDEFISTILDTPAKLWEAWEDVGSSIENANRTAIYEAAIARGKSKAQASLEAKDLLDFSMQGDWVIMRALADTLPFFNARVQGLYKLGRAAVEGDAKTRAKIAGKVSTALVVKSIVYLTLPSLALMAINDGEDWYEELEDWDRDTYWHVRVKGRHFRIPKPFELGMIFATLPERAYRRLSGSDDTKDFAKSLAWNITQTLAMDPVPQAVRPAVEVWANRSMFTGRPIEGQADEGKLPSARYSERTSVTMRSLVDLAPEAFDAIDLSPKEMEHLVRGYLGEMGLYGLNLIDYGVGWAVEAPPKPERRIDEIPLVKSFVRGDPAVSTRWRTEFYDMRRKADQITNTIKGLREQGRDEEADAKEEKEAAKLDQAKSLRQAAKELSQLSKEQEEIRRSRTLSPREKREQLDALMREANEVARDAAQAARPAFR